MILSYALRLLCLSCATFFMAYGLSAILVSVLSGAVVRFAEKLPPKPAARLLFVLRSLPFLLAGGVVLALCVPSYLWLEPQAPTERIGAACGALGILGAALLSVSLTRFLRALAVSRDLYGSGRSATSETTFSGETLPALVVESEAPLLALVGVVRSRLLVSRSVLRVLSADELQAALRHEHAHFASRDNFKRLVFLMVPGIFPFSAGFSRLERSWAKFTEWAADDQAVAGDMRRALSLASALVRVARLGCPPPLAVIHTSLVARDADFSARVERLLRAPLPPPAAPSHRHWNTRSVRGGAGLFAAASLTFLLGPALLSSAHRLLELFLR